MCRPKYLISNAGFSCTFVLIVCLVSSSTTSSMAAEQLNGFFTDVRAVLEWPGVEVPAHVSDDGRTIYLASDGSSPVDPGNDDELDLYAATRESISLPFDEAQKIEELSRDGFQECCQYVTPNGLTTYFAAGWPADNRQFPFNIWMSTRSNETDLWSAPHVVDVGIDGNVWQPRLSRDGLTLYVTGNSGSGTDADLFQATRNAQAEPFGTPQPLAGINSPSTHARNQTVSSDELTILYWLSDRQWSSAEIHVATRDTKNEPFQNPMNIDEFGLGSQVSSVATFLHNPVISPNWPAAGSRLYFGAGNSGSESDIYEATWMVLGDLNSNNVFDPGDIDELALALRNKKTGRRYDVNLDGMVNADDQRAWVHDLKHTYSGDANLDGQFGQLDLVNVLAAGKYGQDIFATWSEGDWNADGLFNQLDVVAALQDDGYLKGPQIAITVVPEPSSMALLFVGVALFAFPRRT